MAIPPGTQNPPPEHDFSVKLLRARRALLGEERWKREEERAQEQERAALRRVEHEQKRREFERAAQEETRRRAEEERIKGEKQVRAALKRREEVLKDRAGQMKRAALAPVQTGELPAPPKTTVVAGKKTLVMRTYALDAAEAVRKQQETLARIALAEQEKKRAEKAAAPVKKSRAGIYVLAVCIALALGGGGYYIYRFEIPAIPEQKRDSVPAPDENSFPSTPRFATLIRADRQITVAVPSAIGAEEFVNLLNANALALPLPQGITYIHLTRSNGSGDAAVRAKEFFHLAAPDAPGSFLRTLDGEIMLGVHTDAGNNRLFIALGIRSNDRAFSEMLSLERRFPTLFPNTLFANVAGEGRMRDIVVDGHDARIWRGDDGSSGWGYLFPSDSVLLIGANETVLGSLAGRVR